MKRRCFVLEDIDICTSEGWCAPDTEVLIAGEK
jgi:hypothetical protein